MAAVRAGQGPPRHGSWGTGIRLELRVAWASLWWPCIHENTRFTRVSLAHVWRYSFTDNLGCRGIGEINNGSLQSINVVSCGGKQPLVAHLAKQPSYDSCLVAVVHVQVVVSFAIADEAGAVLRKQNGIVFGQADVIRFSEVDFS